jgi:hypothetical protein
VSTSDLRARPVLLVLVLVVAAAGVALLMLQRMHGSSGSSESSSAPAPVVQKPAAPKPASKQQRPSRHRAAPAAPKTAKAPTKRLPAADLPVAIRRAFAADQVVVVSLFDPRARIDGSARAEARAGARLAGSSFVPIDVRRRSVESLNAKYGAIQDPAVLVLRPSGELVVRIDGFADRDTVAQAAVNAAS